MTRGGAIVAQVGKFVVRRLSYPMSSNTNTGTRRCRANSSSPSSSYSSSSCSCSYSKGNVMNEPIFDHDKPDVDRLSINKVSFAKK